MKYAYVTAWLLEGGNRKEKTLCKSQEKVLLNTGDVTENDIKAVASEVVRGKVVSIERNGANVWVVVESVEDPNVRVRTLFRTKG